MSKTIDQKVVEMRFDNRDFESNVKTSMSTLDKLKKSLNFKGASKGLEEINTVSKKVDFSGMSNGIETVQAKFSSLQVIGMTALSNITTAAMNVGQNLVSSFTLNPITDGFREYELQMNSVQTILANTASKGTTINDVTVALDELNEYADKTIYNFAEMTRNIGTFTAAGVDLDKSVAAIKGIANLGAMSGSSSLQVNTAMYQLSQALAAGKVSLEDWNSVVSAGMGGEQFRNALKRTAKQMGINVDQMIEKYGTFRESLTKGEWLTAEVLTETLAQISGAYSEAELIQQGYTKSQAQDIIKMAETATDAATKVKTFTQLLDTMKEAAGSGWAKTWQILLGDFEEAKNFFTGLSDYFSEMIGSSADSRNNLLSGAMDSNWRKLSKEIEKAGLPLDTFQEKLEAVAKKNNVDLDEMIEKYGSLDGAMSNISNSGKLVTDTLKSFAGISTEANKSTKSMTDKLEYFQKVVDDVWMGKYKTQPVREKLLTEAGYNYAEVQTLVNKTVDGHRLTLDDLNETQLKAIGYTNEQCAAIKKLSEEAEKSGTTINDLIENLNKPSGRVLFLETIKNTIKAIIEPIRAVKKAFSEVFSVDSSQIYNMIEALHRFSEAVLMDEETLSKLTRTFKGIFGIVKIFTSLLGGGVGLAFNVVTGILENFNIGILDATAFIGDLLYAFSDWITSGDLIFKAMDGISWAMQSLYGWGSKIISKLSEFPSVQNGIKAVADVFEKLRNYFSDLFKMDPSEAIKKFVKDIKDVFANLTWEDVLSSLTVFGENVRNIFSKIPSVASTIGPDIISGLINGLKENTEKVYEKMREIGSKILEAIKALLGIHSPSTEFFEIGKNIILGLIDGLKNTLSGLWDFLKNIGTGIVNTLKELDWGTILTVAAGAGSFVIFYKISSALETFASAAEAFSAPFKNVGKVINSFADVLNAFEGKIKAESFKIKADAIKTLAVSLAILVASIVIITKLDINAVWGAVGVIFALAAILGVLAIALNIFSAKGSALESAKISAVIMSIGTAFLLMAATVKILGGMSEDEIVKAGVCVVAFGVIIAALMAMTRVASKNRLHSVSDFVKSVGVTFILLAVASKIFGSLSEDEIVKAGVCVVAFGVIIAALMALTRTASKKSLDTVSDFVKSVGVTFILLAAASKIFGSLSEDEIVKAGICITAFSGVIAALIFSTKLVSKKDLSTLGKTIISIAGSIAILAITAKIIASMSITDILKSIVFISAFGLVISALILSTKLASKKDLSKLGTTLLAMSASIAILAAVSVLLGLVNISNLVKGLLAVGVLSLFVKMMVSSTKDAKDVKGTMMGIAVAIGVMAAAILVLSFIDTEKLIGATLALGLVMGMFSVMAKASSNINTSFSTIAVLSAVVVLLATCLYVLSGLPVESTLGTAAALSILLLSLSASCKLLDKVNGISKSAYVSLGVMTLIVLGLAGILHLLSMGNVEASIEVAASISILLLTITASLKLLNGAKSTSASALKTMGIISAALVAIVIIFGLLEAYDISPSIDTAISLSTLLLTMSVVVSILGMVGKSAKGASTAAVELVKILGIISLVIIIFGLIARIPKIDWLVTEGGKLLESVGIAIGQFIGGIVSGIGVGLTSGLPAMAENLSDFMDKLKPFIEGSKDLDTDAIDGIKSLADMILTLTGANLLDSIASFIGGSSSLEKFSEDLVPFGEDIREFSKQVDGIKPDAVRAAAEAGSALADLAKSLPKEGGLAAAIFGETTDLDTFGLQLTTFGVSIMAYSRIVDGIEIDSIMDSAKAGEALSDLAKSLPKEGGLAAAIFGETTDLDTFGLQLSTFGTSIMTYSRIVDGIEIDSILQSAKAGEALAELAKSLPKEGGLAAAIFGETTDLIGFGLQLVNFGNAITDYCDIVDDYGEFKPIANSVSAAKSLSDLANSLGRDGGWIGDIFGDKEDLREFGWKLEAFGSSLEAYSKSLEDVTFGDIGSATTKTMEMVSLTRQLSDLDISALDKVNQFETIGTAISNYYKSIESIDTNKIGLSIDVVNRLKNLISSLSEFKSGGIDKFKTAIRDLSTINFDGIIETFGQYETSMAEIGQTISLNISNGMLSDTSTSEIAHAVKNIVSRISNVITNSEIDFKKDGSNIISSIVNGMTDSKKTLISVFKDNVDRSISYIHSRYSDFYDAGKYVVNGFSNGISANTYLAEAKARAMARAAAVSAENELDIESPSKVFYKIGDYAGIGFVNALNNYQIISKKSGTELAESARIGISSAISKVVNYFDTDLDMQPTIRPIMDLSNVQSGVSAINRTIGGVYPNLSFRKASIISRNSPSNQNGNMDEVVSAVEKLRKDLGKIDRASYNINGITYDDGSNISEAVRTLVRAVKVERRT
jgi:tape measure domain-containing protein